MTKWGFLRFLAGVWALIFFLGVGFRVLADCASFGLPFTDLGSTSFCAEIAEAYYTGITHGTSATTFSPSANVTRDQAAAFATRTLDAALARGSRRAALGQWWTTTPHWDAGLGVITIGGAHLGLPQSDGADVWVPIGSLYPPAAVATQTVATDSVARVRASDGKVLEMWTGATGAAAALVAMGRVFVTGLTIPGNLYMIDPSQPPGNVASVSNTVGNNPFGLAFDGQNIWTANTTDRSVSIISPGSWNVNTISLGTASPFGLVFDGTNMWATDLSGGSLLRLNADGTIAQTIAVGDGPEFPAFDGRNIWVPNHYDNTLTVVRALDGAVLKKFSAANGNLNGLSGPNQAAFDGQRILVTSASGRLSLFKAADLSAIGFVLTPGVSNTFGVCSDGVNFWVSFLGSGKIGRF